MGEVGEGVEAFKVPLPQNNPFILIEKLLIFLFLLRFIVKESGWFGFG